MPLDVRHTVDFGRKIVDADRARSSSSPRRQTEASARALGLPIILIETLPDLARRAEPLAAGRRSAPMTLAEIVFTSGTTGEPKGAMLSHGNLVVVRDRDDRRSCRSGPSDRLLSVLPLSHLYEQVLGFIGPLHGRGERRLPGQPPAGGARPDVPRLQGHRSC